MDFKKLWNVSGTTNQAISSKALEEARRPLPAGDYVVAKSIESTQMYMVEFTSETVLVLLRRHVPRLPKPGEVVRVTFDLMTKQNAFEIL